MAVTGAVSGDTYVVNLFVLTVNQIDCVIKGCLIELTYAE